MSNRRDEKFPSPFEGLELAAGGGGSAAPDKRQDKEASEKNPEIVEKPARLSRKQIRAIKGEVEKAEESLTAYL